MIDFKDMSKVISCLEVRELHSLYIHINILVELCKKKFKETKLYDIKYSTLAQVIFYTVVVLIQLIITTAWFQVIIFI